MPERWGGGIYIPTHEIEPYLANGWRPVGDLNPHEVLMLPPDGRAGLPVLGDNPREPPS